MVAEHGAILGVCMVAGHDMVLYWVSVWLQDMVLYSVFAFLYLVGTSLVASAFDFYQKMKTNVSNKTVHQLVIVVVRIRMCPSR